MEEIHKTFRPWDAAANATRLYSPASELPEDDLVFFLLETVPQLNLSAFYSQYAETRGAPPFDVELMCTLLAYSYCVGVFSSRKIAAACERNLAFKAIVGSDRPDFRTISDFRKLHLDAFGDLFIKVLRLAGELGMVKLGNLALDGSKFNADASRHKAMSYGYMTKEVERLRGEIDELLKRAGQTDAVIVVMERAAVAVPESAEVQYRLALVYENNARRGDAIDAYEKAIALNGDLALAKNNLAYLLTETGGDLDRALELAQQAKEQLPDNGSAADTLGWVLLKRGVPSAAIGYLQEATERFPSEAFEIQGIVRNHLAEAFEMNQEADKAIVESRISVDQYQALAKLAEAKGEEFEEPEWSRQARERIERLEAAS